MMKLMKLLLHEILITVSNAFCNGGHSSIETNVSFRNALGSLRSWLAAICSHLDQPFVERHSRVRSILPADHVRSFHQSWPGLHPAVQTASRASRSGAQSRRQPLQHPVGILRFYETKGRWFWQPR